MVSWKRETKTVPLEANFSFGRIFNHAARHSFNKIMKDKIYNFFEHPKGFWAIFIQIIIFSLILISVGIVVLELFNRNIFAQYKQQFELLNHVILFVFTV